MSALVLSLFPGLGFLDAAFEAEGFCVVRGPDLLWGGDIGEFRPPPGVFDGVIGGPPCQAFSRLRHIVEHNGYQVAPNLIPEYERCVLESRPGWFLMENVPDAPEPMVQGYRVSSVLVDDASVGGKTTRVRRFSFGIPGDRTAAFLVDVLPLFPQAEALTVTRDARSTPVAVGGSGKRKRQMPNRGASLPVDRMLELQGFPGDLLDGCPLTMSGKRDAVGNGVPFEMGRAVARAVKAGTTSTEGS